MYFSFLKTASRTNCLKHGNNRSMAGRSAVCFFDYEILREYWILFSYQLDSYRCFSPDNLITNVRGLTHKQKPDNNSNN